MSLPGFLLSRLFPMKLFDNLSPRLVVVCLATVFLMEWSASTQAQTVPRPDDSDIQDWNEVQVSKRIHPQVDVMISGALRFGSNLTHFDDGRFGGQMTLRLNKFISFSPGCFYVSSHPEFKTHTPEVRFVEAINFSLPYKRFEISNRHQFEQRNFLTSRPDFSRYRNRVQVEYKLEQREHPVTLIGSAEWFYNLTTGDWFRSRIGGGIRKQLTHHLSVETMYIHQSDSVSTPGVVHIISSIFRIRL